MAKNRIKEIVSDALSDAGIQIGGDRPWDIRVHNPDFYIRVLAQHSIGLGESYMDGLWDCDQLELFFDRLNRADLAMRKRTLSVRYHFLKARLLNMQSPARAFQVGRVHYDKGNDLYSAMLGPRMVYSSGYYRDPGTNLAEAEEAKLDLICRKLELRGGEKILDIGCGWGSFAKYASEVHGAKVVGITVSKEQQEFAQEHCAGLPIDIRLQDYRETQGEFDHVVAIGMIGHVGHKNYRSLMEVAARCLSNGGLFLIHTLGANRSTTAADPWIDKYIFPNGMAPSVTQLAAAAENLFVVEDWHNFSTDYCRTTLAWRLRFEENWDRIKSSYDNRFYRMWRYYLSYFAGAFHSRALQAWDIVLSKEGSRGKYISPR